MLRGGVKELERQIQRSSAATRTAPRRPITAPISRRSPACPGRPTARTSSTSTRPRGARPATTTTSTRSRSASSSSWRCASSTRRPRARSSASSARRASARPRSGARSPAPWDASSRASRSAACATRPRSAATAAPTSAPAGTHHPGHPAGGHLEPGLHARRDRQARRGLPRRSLLGAARGARPGAELSFRDHYLGVAYDLSQVMFITTGNLTEPIQPAFLDRMEVIRLSGYTSEEKLQIAKRHLIPQADRRERPDARQISFTTPASSGHQRLHQGVRAAQPGARAGARSAARWRSGGRAARPAARHLRPRVEELLGPPKHSRGAARAAIGSASPPGSPGPPPAATCCSSRRWRYPASGKLVLTGQLGEVMKESAQAASPTRALRHERRARDFFERTTSTSTCRPARSQGRTVGRHHHRHRDRLAADRAPGRPQLAMTGEITCAATCCRSVA